VNLNLIRSLNYLFKSFDEDSNDLTLEKTITRNLRSFKIFTQRQDLF